MNLLLAIVLLIGFGLYSWGLYACAEKCGYERAVEEVKRRVERLRRDGHL